MDIKVADVEVGKTYLRNNSKVKVIAKVKYGATLEEETGKKTMVSLDTVLQTDGIPKVEIPAEAKKIAEQMENLTKSTVPADTTPLPPAVAEEVDKVVDDGISDQAPEVKSKKERTGVTKVIDNILLTAPSEGYTIAEVLGKIKEIQSNLPEDKKMKTFIHARIWHLKKSKGCTNISVLPHKYSLRKPE